MVQALCSMPVRTADVALEQVNDSHVLLGAGVEYVTRLGIGLRAELISFERDANIAQLGLTYRYGRKSGSNRPLIVKDSPTPDKVTPTPVIAAVKPVDSDSDTVLDSIDQCPGTTTEVAVDEQGCAVYKGTIEGVNFYSDSAILTAEAKRRLDVVVNILKSYPRQAFILSAHTDNEGSEQSNLALSRKRALTAAKYIYAGGIAKGRFTIKAYGERRPLTTNDTAEGRQRNRRVELTVLK